MKNNSENSVLPTYIPILIFICIVLLSLTSSAQSNGRPVLPTIISFKATHKTTNERDKKETNWIELSWQTQGANKVRLYRDGMEIKGRIQLISGEVGWPLSLKGGFRIQYKSHAIYELVAENNIGKSSKKLKINRTEKKKYPILMPPEIQDFRIQPQTVKLGDEISFYWKVKNASRVRLYEGSYEIKSGIQLSNGNYGWPLYMNGYFSTTLRESETYKLLVTGKNGKTISKSVRASVNGKKCRLLVTITGGYSKYTDHIYIYKGLGNPSNDKFLFKTNIAIVRNQGKVSYRFTIPLQPGDYTIVPSGGGKDKHGDFGVMYEPRSIHFTCRDGNSKHITIKTHGAEY